MDRMGRSLMVFEAWSILDPFEKERRTEKVNVRTITRNKPSKVSGSQENPIKANGEMPMAPFCKPARGPGILTWPLTKQTRKWYIINLVFCILLHWSILPLPKSKGRIFCDVVVQDETLHFREGAKFVFFCSRGEIVRVLPILCLA